MHPILAQSRRFILYLLGWIPTAALLTYLLVKSSQLAWGETVAVVAPLMLLFAFVCLSPWYLCRRLPLRTTSLWKLLFHHLSAAVLSSLLWIALADGLALSLSRFFPDLPERLSPHLVIIFGIGVLLYELAVALHYVALAIQASRQSELLARDAELKALKAQINPHFLFNSLHSISALTAVDPARAREMCIRLSDFLRNTLGLGDRASISLGEELALVKTYLDIEQVRFGSRLRVERQIEPGCEHIQIPPLLLQPLVENAIKHGVATLVDGGSIRLEARQAGEFLSVVVENEFDPEAPSNRRSGVGLPNVRSRLRTRYGSDARLETSVEDNRYRAQLVLPADL
ncbi:MAG TPA: histidine kinase [Bryobacteraceae bacterium]|nr:histidine kinase [Bryobacteraceae bacterium]